MDRVNNRHTTMNSDTNAHIKTIQAHQLRYRYVLAMKTDAKLHRCENTKVGPIYLNVNKPKGPKLLFARV